MNGFFSKLNYSLGNEDWETERRALQIRPSDEVCCITASGDRPLHLLLCDCRRLTAIDANVAQNHLLKLKCAALQELDYDTYLGFLGAMPHGQRDDLLRRISPHLDAESAQFWLQNAAMVRKGILYQ